MLIGYEYTLHMFTPNKQTAALLVVIGLVIVVCFPSMGDICVNFVLGGLTLTACLLEEDRRLRAIAKILRQKVICEVLQAPVFRLLRSVLPIGLPTTISTGLLSVLCVAPAAAPPLPR